MEPVVAACDIDAANARIRRSRIATRFVQLGEARGNAFFTPVMPEVLFGASPSGQHESHDALQKQEFIVTISRRHSIGASARSVVTRSRDPKGVQPALHLR